MNRNHQIPDQSFKIEVAVALAQEHRHQQALYDLNSSRLFLQNDHTPIIETVRRTVKTIPNATATMCCRHHVLKRSRNKMRKKKK